MTEIRNAAGSSAVPITFSNASELDTMSFGSNHQGVAAAVRHKPPADLEDLAHASSADGPPLILATDQVQDVGNLGALLRTLEAVDGAGIVVPSRRSASITGGLARASAGASLRTRIVEVTNVSRALNDLREAGVWLAEQTQKTGALVTNSRKVAYYADRYRDPKVWWGGKSTAFLLKLSKDRWPKAQFAAVSIQRGENDLVTGFTEAVGRSPLQIFENGHGDQVLVYDLKD